MVRSARLAVAGCVYVALMTAILGVSPTEAATLTLRWDPSADTTIGYRVRWGTTSGRYTEVVDVGRQAFFTFEAPTPPTTYYFAVTAYDTAGRESAVSEEINTGSSTVRPLRLTSVTAGAASPQVAGTTITFDAVAEGGAAPYQYKWQIFDGAAWSTGSEWSTSRAFSWRPALPGEYRVTVWVRSATSSTDAPENSDAEHSLPFVVAAAGTWVPTIESSLAAPQPEDAAIRFTAHTDTNEPRYRYKWWVFDGVSWSVAKEWSASRSFVWKPRVPNPQYQVLVRVKHEGNPADTGGAAIPFPIVPRELGAARPVAPSTFSSHFHEARRTLIESFRLVRFINPPI